MSNESCVFNLDYLVTRNLLDHCQLALFVIFIYRSRLMHVVQTSQRPPPAIPQSYQFVRRKTEARTTVAPKVPAIRIVEVVIVRRLPSLRCLYRLHCPGWWSLLPFRFCRVGLDRCFVVHFVTLAAMVDS
jgi:hypothetical protein